MLLNRAEFLFIDSPLRRALLRWWVAPRLLRLGGAVTGGRVLELGCGSGNGTELVLDVFGAGSVEGFDLDPRLVRRARARLARYGDRVRTWVGDAIAIGVPDERYDAVFDFGIIHHVPDWRRALAEVHRVLRPGGRFYAEEYLRRLISNPVMRRLFEHPREDRFDAEEFRRELVAVGLEPIAHLDHLGCVTCGVAARSPGARVGVAPANLRRPDCGGPSAVVRSG